MTLRKCPPCPRYVNYYKDSALIMCSRRQLQLHSHPGLFFALGAMFDLPSNKRPVTNEPHLEYLINLSDVKEKTGARQEVKVQFRTSLSSPPSRNPTWLPVQHR